MPWAATVLALATQATAADVRILVQGVRSADGQVMVAVCSPQGFLGRACDHVASAPARAGVTEVLVQDVPPGVYAVQAVHDENGNRDLDRNRLGLPLEGFGFSRDAPIFVGPPRFADAAVQVGAGGGTLSFAMRYFATPGRGAAGH